MNAALKAGTLGKDAHDTHGPEEELDVLIIGGGLSGLGMARTMKRERPQDRFAIIESRERVGGTWDLFRYPGIRSDSDMYTFAYSFKPWREQEMVGTGERIRNYLNELASEEGLFEHIRFEQRVVRADWLSERAVWRVRVKTASGEYVIAARFLVTCTGYYNYDAGYLPDFAGKERFKGQVVHPQHWPEALDYAGKEVVVIGSGATAVTLVPAMAQTAAHVTMLQRSPSYVVSTPARDWLFALLRKALPAKLTNRIMRAKYITLQQLVYMLAQRFPRLVRKIIRMQNKHLLGGAANVDEHFKPRYQPWDERLCMVPDEDLFASLREGRASIVTDHIATFTETGVELTSGKHLDADIIVPATGLNLQFWGGMTVTVDGAEVSTRDLINYKGMMFSQMPNFVTIFGYSNASWTLKAELSYEYVTRLLAHMEKKGHRFAYPYATAGLAREDFVSLQSGYVKRAKAALPAQGDTYPWRNKDFYWKDIFAIRRSELDDGVLRFDDPRPLRKFHQQAEATQMPDENKETKRAQGQPDNTARSTVETARVESEQV